MTVFAKLTEASIMKIVLGVAVGWIILGLIVLYLNYRFWEWLGEPRED